MRWNSLWVTAVASGWLLAAGTATAAEPGETGEGQTRVSRQAAPTVRIVRTSAPAACGDWGAITVQACRPMAPCDAARIGGNDVAPLDDALDASLSTSLKRSCSGLSCGAVRTRNDQNRFACRGRSELCMTRTLEYTCLPTRAQPPPERTSREVEPARQAPRRVADPGRDDPRPARTPDRESEATPERPRTVAVPAHIGVAPDDEPIEPLGGSGQAGAPAVRTSRPTVNAARPRVPALGGTRRSADRTGGYAFPGKADELESREYWYWKAPDGHGSGSQQYAYDLTTGRYYESTGSWSECRADAKGNPRCGLCSNAANNADCLVYNEPLFAMAAGEVERCWRNAPENPAPGQSHQGRTSTPKRIGGGGNFLLVRQDDGNYALYAHMKPGTIPAALCPKNEPLMSDASDPSESTIPEGQRPRLAVGQLVGRVGNTGASSNPHLHVHVQDGPTRTDAGVPLNFTGGYMTEADADYEDAWERLDGRTRPTKTSAIWPNFSAGLPEIAYHGLSAALYQKLFDHASGSGYRLEWIDGFVVKGKTYFNVLFRPRAGIDWSASHNLTGEQYQKTVDARKAQGMRLWHADSYLVGSTVYYAAVFVKDGKTAAAYHGATQAEHQEKFDSWTGSGWRPRSISVVSINGQRRYAAVYEKAGGPFLARSALTGAEYQDLTSEQYANGRQLVYLNVYEHQGQPYFSAIYAPVAGARKALHGLSSSDYQREWEAAREGALRTRCITGYLDGGTVRYAAAWGK